MMEALPINLARDQQLSGSSLKSNGLRNLPRGTEVITVISKNSKERSGTEGKPIVRLRQRG